MNQKIKVLVTTIAMFVMVSFCLSVNAQKVTDISYNQVPAKAQTFITTHFPGQVAEKAFINRVTSSPTYNIVMRNRTSIVFGPKGVWKEIDGQGNSIPYTMLPKTAQEYIKNQLQNVGVGRIAKNGKNFDVKLGSGEEHKFNNKGKHINSIGGGSNIIER